MFIPTSRYYSIERATLETAQGETVVFVRRRFVPPASRFAPLHEHAVSQGERLDHIAAAHLGNAEMFWRLCDANGAMRPDELIESPGRRLRITLPEGIPGPANA